ncbi:transposase [Planococcus sp. ISL-110]|uniref:transposase n=1 Tax=Planococcus sp. ISL-110 TaxID=2819167 RepID=UPI001BE926DA|nr:transposase [Planococcus sp. ISL-110]MBT2572175.1 transposase [Planococcus sp. ISL-110]
MGKHKDAEYKEYIAKLHIEEGRKATDLAYEIGVSATTVRHWAREYREKQDRLANPTGEPMVTFSEMEKKLREAENRLKERDDEVEILKKAMHVFMKSRT